MGGTQDRLAFDRPPVREVRLAFMFGTVGKLRSAYIGGLYDRWRAEYPDVMESPPVQPFNRSDLTQATDEDYMFLSEDSAWPIPLTTFENSETGKKIVFQADRFAINWDFESSESDSYPGFDSLGDELVARFAEFSAQLKETPAGAPQLTHVECLYINEISGITPRQFAHGLLTDWRESDEIPAATNEYESSSFRQHFHLEGLETGVWVVVAPAKGDAKGGTELSIRVLREVSSSDADWRTELESCHEVENEQFLASTSRKMREAWGER